MVLVCYLDDSSADSSTVVTVAGYVAPEDIWERYELHAEEVYREFGVGVLHTMDFEHRHGEFKEWDRPKSVEFLDALFRGFEQHLFGVSISVRKTGHDARKKKNPEIFRQEGAYATAFGNLLAYISHFGPTGPYAAKNGISFVLEFGRKHNPGMKNYFRQVKQSQRHLPLRTITEVTKSDCRAVHLADLAAFYSRRWAARVDLHESPGMEVLTGNHDPLFAHVLSKGPFYLYVVQDPASGEGKLDEKGNFVFVREL